jgi:glyoxylase-like metal-dependent hydrolase (beta-lactamase superfamily II)
MIFTLDVRRARKGDCLIVHYGSKTEPGLMLIDGGPADVYQPHLKPRLAEIRKARGLAANATLPVDLLMVSHIDDDHIKGVLELTKEMIQTEGPPPLKINGLWHNTFDDIIGNNPDKLRAAVTASFGAASLSGDGEEVEGLDPEAAKVLASVDQ